MTKTRPSGRRGPVALGGSSRRHPRTIRPRDTLLGAEALDMPVPGQLLVLLSRLSRAETKGTETEGKDHGASCACPRGP